MLFQTVVLLLLCVSTGTCATLGNYQMQSNEEEGPASDSAAVTEGVLPAVSVDAAKKDVAAADAQEAVSPAADKTAANAHSADKLLAQMLMDAAAEKPEGDRPIAYGATAEEPGTESDKAATEALTEVAVGQEDTSLEVEWNEIRSVKTNQSLDRPLAHENDDTWSLSSIRNSLQSMHGYFDSLVELVGGRNGVCEYHCKYEEPPEPRPGYQLPEPNGCSSSLVGFQLDLGIPAMTKCCNQLDICYDTCGTSKYNCDSKFRSCLHSICSDLKKSLGFVSKVQACESMADALFNTVWTLGCRPYMNSQRAACVCRGDERDEL
ncbi:hypothetical protein Q5P01_021317 [Channa striata]|uniref:Group XIIB secretory phospholipase A2-like protein n=1 Tax=Channa striata TaxID=64152 RepID=A0AA88LUR0_CHASR|nr:hypothetical protein Q5P01_021317 [Channa striata]